MTNSALLRIAGVDEAGRGPLAGPLVVAAVILDPARPICGINDSKKLSEAQREALYPQITELALAYCIVEIDAAEIDQHNILQATLKGMRAAVSGLDPAAELALIDGNRIPPDLPCPARAIVGGDASEAAIGAASILAKVRRDQLMRDWHAVYPQYEFASHKGYPSPRHLKLLEQLGPCPIHRLSYAPVRAAIRTERFDRSAHSPV